MLNPDPCSAPPRRERRHQDIPRAGQHAQRGRWRRRRRRGGSARVAGNRGTGAAVRVVPKPRGARGRSDGRDERWEVVDGCAQRDHQRHVVRAVHAGIELQLVQGGLQHESAHAVANCQQSPALVHLPQVPQARGHKRSLLCLQGATAPGPLVHETAPGSSGGAQRT